MIDTVFQYQKVMWMANDTWAKNEIRFFGNVISGTLSLSDIVLVPVVGSDSIPAKVDRFTEDFTQEWVGLPFYNSVNTDPTEDPFCVCLDGGPLAGAIIAPSGQLIVQPQHRQP